ncbi:unnamed protein product [Orchesella dallaii]|uniref:C2H2-type domain-containing protein n=1 Tax=Orchesella dallaii TaxID=48710 RepID=A0ABP1RYP4_9HEXA
MEEENQPGCSKAFVIPKFEEGEEVNGNDSHCENGDEQQQDCKIMEQEHHPTNQQHPGSLRTSAPESKREAQLQNAINKRNTELANLKTERFNTKIRVNALNIELEMKNAHMAQIEKKNLEVGQKNLDLEEDMVSLNNELKTSQTEKEKLELKNNENEKKISELEKDNQLLRDQLDTTKSEVKRKDKEYKSMMVICEMETDKCNEVKEQLTLSKNRVKELEDKLAKEQDKQRVSANELGLMKMDFENFKTSCNTFSASFTRHIEKYGDDDVVDHDEGDERNKAKVSEGDANDDDIIFIENQNQKVIPRTTRSTTSNYYSSRSKFLLVKQVDSPQEQLRGGGGGGRPRSGDKGRKKFPCTYMNCKKNFASAKSLTMHERKQHDIVSKKKRSKATSLDPLGRGKLENSAGKKVTFAEICNHVAAQSALTNTNAVVDIAVNEPAALMDTDP